MVDGKPSSILVEVAGIEYQLRQSPGLLTSSNSEGTTGAALWKISPLVAEWLQDTTNALWTTRILHKESVIVELGCGITGLIGLVMAAKVGKYILTDQFSVLKVLQANVDANIAAPMNDKARKKKQFASPIVHGLNWEDDNLSLDEVLDENHQIDVILICDCVFNEFLIQPLITTCRSLCRRTADRTPILLIAQQLRSDQIFTSFMESLLQHFSVWRVKDEALSHALQAGSGFALHAACLKTSE